GPELEPMLAVEHVEQNQVACRGELPLPSISAECPQPDRRVAVEPPEHVLSFDGERDRGEEEQRALLLHHVFHVDRRCIRQQDLAGPRRRPVGSPELSRLVEEGGIEEEEIVDITDADEPWMDLSALRQDENLAGPGG